MSGLKARIRVIAAGIILIALFLLYAFWPRPVYVDMAAAERGAMMVTINEEARTRVRDAYTLSTPIAGRVLRIESEPGDPVTSGDIVARMTPADPTLIDVRSEEQAKAAVNAADAALAAARAGVTRAEADAAFARDEMDRTRTLFESDNVSKVALDNAERSWRSASANLEAARSTVTMREAELDNARAALMSHNQAQRLAMSTNPHPREILPIRAPVSGQILRVLQESESVTPAGTPLMEIGDPHGDLEVVAELLSTDAVKVEPGNRVIIVNWGGGEDLTGTVERIEPWAFTKYSALGVEEQRVRTIIRLDSEADAYARLGHGFRVEARIVTWEEEDALNVPSNAVFRTQDGLAVFKVAGNKAQLTPVTVGRDNGVSAQITAGLAQGELVILYPGNMIEDGLLVRQRETG